jgi:hypothetical protein
MRPNVEIVGYLLKRGAVSVVSVLVEQVNVNQFVANRRGRRRPPPIREVSPGECDRYWDAVTILDRPRTALGAGAHLPGEVAHAGREVVLGDHLPSVDARDCQQLLVRAALVERIPVDVDARWTVTVTVCRGWHRTTRRYSPHLLARFAVSR